MLHQDIDRGERADVATTKARKKEKKGKEKAIIHTQAAVETAYRQLCQIICPIFLAQIPRLLSLDLTNIRVVAWLGPSSVFCFLGVYYDGGRIT
jgi:hypothetical protein